MFTAKIKLKQTQCIPKKTDDTAEQESYVKEQSKKILLYSTRC